MPQDKELKSIQEIFVGRYAFANSALVQKLRPSKQNLERIEGNFTEHWPSVRKAVDILVVVIIGESSQERRRLKAGFIQDVQPSLQYDKKTRIYVDRFDDVGFHDLTHVSDVEFYGKGPGGGSRVIIPNMKRSVRGVASSVPGGQMEQRLTWVRRYHEKFRDLVFRHWERRCAVLDSDCNGLLVASHIFPWARCTSEEQTDVNNGLLLTAPLDLLFDRGYISFSDNGYMLVEERLTERTRVAFGLPADAKIKDTKKLILKMRSYLARHRKNHGFAEQTEPPVLTKSSRSL